MTREIFCRVWTRDGSQNLTKNEWQNFDKSQLYREDGPAIEKADGTKYWYIDGERHRIDGPAVKWSDGKEFWFIDGRPYPTKEIEAWLKENDIDLQTKEGLEAFKLRWL